MSITDELRKYAQDWRENPSLMDDLDAGDIDGLLGDFEHIADRIDAEHERECKEQYAIGAEHGIGASIDASMIQVHGYIELPKDADGEYINVGDRLDGYGKTIEVVELRYGRSGWVLISRDGNGYADTFAFTHHAPTVEDVLTEMVAKVIERSELTNGAAQIIAEYAAKLRLAEGEDA